MKVYVGGGGEGEGGGGEGEGGGGGGDGGGGLGDGGGGARGRPATAAGGSERASVRSGGIKQAKKPVKY